MKTGRIVGGLALALVLAACGGDGSSSPPPATGGGGGGGGTPTPTPPPPPTYTAFADLTGDQDFATVCSGRRAGSGEGVLGTSDFGTGIGLSFQESTSTWTVRPPTGIATNLTELTYGPDELVSETANASSYQRRDSGGSVTSGFGFGFADDLNPSPLYVRGAGTTELSASGLDSVSCVFGVPTVLDDQLPTITATNGFLSYADYSFSGQARVRETTGGLTQFVIEDSTVDFRADPRDGSISVEIQLQGREIMIPGGDLSDTITPLGTITGSTNIDGSTQNFRIGFSTEQTDTSLISGSLAGWFFGPQGVEVGFAFDGFQVRSDGATVFVAGGAIGTGGAEFTP